MRCRIKSQLLDRFADFAFHGAHLIVLLGSNSYSSKELCSSGFSCLNPRFFTKINCLREEDERVFTTQLRRKKYTQIFDRSSSALICLEVYLSAIFRNFYLHGSCHSLARQLFSREQAVVNRFHVHAHHLRLRRSAAHPHHVSGGHGDGIAMQKLCCSGIRHNYLRTVLL